jgi:hypothetical protein
MPKRLKPHGDLNPEAATGLLLRLLAVTNDSEFQLSPQMLGEIDAISIEGADPEWQTRELQRILDKWAIQH